MSVIRPTLRVVTQLPRVSFYPPTIFDEVKLLSAAPLETRKMILERLNLENLNQDLLKDARSYLDKGILPELHKSSTQKLGKPVYEVRSHQGAAWRGAVIVDDEGDWWLVYVDRHDQFHTSASKFFGSSNSVFLPSELDRKLRDQDRARRDELEKDTAILLALSQSLAEAIQHPGEQYQVSLPSSVDHNDFIMVSVEFPEMAESVSTMHETVGEVSVTITMDVANEKLRSRFLGLYVPFIQPDTAMREQIYGQDYRSIYLNMLVSQAQLAQFLVSAESAGSLSPATPPEPTVRHWAGQTVLTASYVEVTAVEALCGTWFVPSRDGEALPEIPICPDCEQIEPVAQQLQDIIRSLSPGG